MDKLSRVRRFVLACVCLIPLASGCLSAFAADQLYWVESGEIRRVGVDGTGIEQVLSADDSHATISIALDSGNDAMFWGAWIDPYTRAIWGSNLQGDGITQLAVPWSEGLGYLTVDPTNRKVYYTDPSDCIPDCGSIWRMNQDGSQRERILTQDTPFAIAVYPAGGRMCWGDQENDWIRCSNLDGSSVQTVVTDTNAQGLAIDPTSAKLYWTDDFTQAIRRSDLDGSNVEDLVTGLDDPWGITLDSGSSRMFWTDRGAGKIQSAGLDGSNLTDILTGLDSPRGIAFLPESADEVPAVSGWGLVAMVLLLLGTSTIVLLHNRRRTRN